MKKGKIIAVLLIAILFGICGFSYGKYISNSVKDYYLKSKGFYFSSDNLSINGTQNVNSIWDGNKTYFNLKNNLNQNVITNYDISYELSCEVEGDVKNYVACYLDGKEESTQIGVLSSSEICVNSKDDGVDVSSYTKTDCEINGYDWLSQISTNEIYFDVVKTDETYNLKDVTVKITATSSQPYQETLTGKFILSKETSIDDNINLKYLNYSNYDKLVIANSYSAVKCLTISWDANKTRINSDNISSYQVDDNGYINEINLNIDGKSAIDYTFYPIGESTSDDFVLVENTCQ